MQILSALVYVCIALQFRNVEALEGVVEVHQQIGY